MATLKRLRPLWLALGLAFGLGLLWTQFAARAQSVACSPGYAIDVTLNSGARWQMCWETRSREGIVLHDITYTAPGQPARMVLAQANLAQVHVPYDDDGARFHDLSDFGFGGVYLDDLTPADCPNGTLIRESTKDVLCQQIDSAGYNYKYYSTQAQGEFLNLFSVSHIGAYNYVPQWRFYDNGAIEPSVGATGQLQRIGSNPAYGWLLNSNNTYGISHIHTYYWRLDFDLNGTTNDDVVEEIEFTPNGAQDHFAMGLTAFITETARPVSPITFRSWRVKDASVTNTDGHAISYHLEANPAHLFHGPTYEPFTQNEFYVTVNDVCERFVSNNVYGGGCGGENVTQFVNGQSLTSADIVVWYGLTFHHLPRDEDQNYMYAHWSNFVIAPRDWSALNPLVGVSTITPTASPTSTGQPTVTPTPTITATPSISPTPTITSTPGGVFIPVFQR